LRRFRPVGYALLSLSLKRRISLIWIIRLFFFHPRRYHLPLCGTRCTCFSLFQRSRAALSSDSFYRGFSLIIDPIVVRPSCCFFLDRDLRNVFFQLELFPYTLDCSVALFLVSDCLPYLVLLHSFGASPPVPPSLPRFKLRICWSVFFLFYTRPFSVLFPRHPPLAACTITAHTDRARGRVPPPYARVTLCFLSP